MFGFDRTGRTASRKRDRKWQSARTLESWVPVSSVRWNALEELLHHAHTPAPGRGGAALVRNFRGFVKRLRRGSNDKSPPFGRFGRICRHASGNARFVEILERSGCGSRSRRGALEDIFQIVIMIFVQAPDG